MKQVLIILAIVAVLYFLEKGVWSPKQAPAVTPTPTPAPGTYVQTTVPNPVPLIPGPMMMIQPGY